MDLVSTCELVACSDHILRNAAGCLRMFFSTRIKTHTGRMLCSVYIAMHRYLPVYPDS
jgi:hypothetical protein